MGQGQALSEAEVEQLVARADGVPLFAEELTRSVSEAEAGAARTIPMTLQDSLLARLDRLSSAKEVAQRASVLGREFSYPLLAAVAGLDEPVLRQGLARLVESELLFERGEPPDATYTFKHALVQEAAYESLLKRTRQQLHGRVVDVLAAGATAEPERLARHAEAAGRIDDAIASYQRAGEEARARSAHEEAIRHLRQAITLLVTQPESRERDAREAPLQLALAGSVNGLQGYAHPDVGAAYERARVLCEAVGDTRGLGWASAGLSVFHFNSGQLERGRTLAARVLAIGDETGDEDLANRGHHDVGNVDLFQGRFASSLAHGEAVVVHHDAGRNRPIMHGNSITDRDVTVLGLCAWSLVGLGRPDRALARAREAVALGRRIGHPYSLAYGLFYETFVHWQRRDASAQRERAAETMALSEADGFSYWLGLAGAAYAAARVATGEREAVADMVAALGLATESGQRGGAPGLLTLLGEAYLAADLRSEARGAVEGGFALAAQTGQPFFDAELHRLRGELVLVDGGAPDEAEAAFQRALEIARAQEAKSFELRTATSLARLWRDQGKSREAHALLAPIYGWFTEGFDTRDLVEAKALLEAIR